MASGAVQSSLTFPSTFHRKNRLSQGDGPTRDSVFYLRAFNYSRIKSEKKQIPTRTKETPRLQTTGGGHWTRGGPDCGEEGASAGAAAATVLHQVRTQEESGSAHSPAPWATVQTLEGYAPVGTFVQDGVVPEHLSFWPYKVAPKIGVHGHRQP